jgi:hypothetical protein
MVVTLQAAGPSVVAYHSEGENSARLLLPGVIFASSIYAFLQGANVRAVLTEGDEFHALGLPAQQGPAGETCRFGLAWYLSQRDMRSPCFRYAGVGGRFYG